MALGLIKNFGLVVAVTATFISSASHTNAAVSSQVALSAPAKTDPQNSLDFTVYKSWCESDEEQRGNWQVQLGYCLGYLQGLYWGQVISSTDSKRPFCLPSPLSKSDMVDALETYARAHPAKVASFRMTAEQTAEAVSHAFRDYFSCR